MVGPVVGPVVVGTSGGTRGWSGGGTSGWTNGGSQWWVQLAGAGLERLRPQSFNYLFVVSFRRGWLVGWSLTSQVDERHTTI